MKKRIVYTQNTYIRAPIQFTGTGHVDMDAFDEGGDNVLKTIVTFEDEELEALCRPVIEGYEASLIKEKVDFDADDVSIEREVILYDGKTLDISYFWGVGDWEYEGILDLGNGFTPKDYGWAEDATDIDGKPYDWEGKELAKQIPKRNDFLLVCEKQIAHDLSGVCRDWDGCPNENLVEGSERFTKMVMLYRNLYRGWE
jgi:hypothetical protein